jgi:hypothetical protein
MGAIDLIQCAVRQSWWVPLVGLLDRAQYEAEHGRITRLEFRDRGSRTMVPVEGLTLPIPNALTSIALDEVSFPWSGTALYGAGHKICDQNDDPHRRNARSVRTSDV